MTGDVASEVESVPVELLLPADSPRLTGEDPGHVEALAQSGRALAPILVHRASRKVVDGRHRLRAAALRGEQEVLVRYLEGPEEEIFIRAVEANVAHGLPLTLADRRAAARRILASHPGWSDRAIARVTGLSPKTVGAARRCSSEENPQSIAGVVPTVRVGRDGRVRPLDPAEGRRAAAKLFAERPDASLREVSRAVGISVSTAHDVRRMLQRGEGLLRSGRSGPGGPGEQGGRSGQGEQAGRYAGSVDPERAEGGSFGPEHFGSERFGAGLLVGGPVAAEQLMVGRVAAGRGDEGRPPAVPLPPAPVGSHRAAAEGTAGTPGTVVPATGPDPAAVARVVRQARPGSGPARSAAGAVPPQGAGERAPGGAQPAAAILERLAKDPSLRFTESGRLLLRWLGARDLDARTRSDLVAAVPPHCAVVVADLASSYAREWSSLAEELARAADRA
ncbi:ParB N-terminal domain-containing protein [Kitasatospora sp. NPDC096147]|uniref:ParB/RepB/Spo0J family partition protein n=1 Tax=Kitasatospora sp. NPDC096147 TaxID=3364093 RepID=UPI00380665BD